MKVLQDIATGQVVVEYCLTHNSHSVELALLPTDIKYEVAAKLYDGVSVDKILDDIREKMTNDTIGHEQLLSRQDIHNIRRHLNLGSITKNANDLLSNSAWVEDIRAMPYNPVLIFKQQGVQQVHYG